MKCFRDFSSKARKFFNHPWLFSWVFANLASRVWSPQDTLWVVTLPETNSLRMKINRINRWKIKFPLGWPIFWDYVSSRDRSCFPYNFWQLFFKCWWTLGPRLLKPWWETKCGAHQEVPTCAGIRSTMLVGRVSSASETKHGCNCRGHEKILTIEGKWENQNPLQI